MSVGDSIKIYGRLFKYYFGIIQAKEKVPPTIMTVANDGGNGQKAESPFVSSN